MKLKNHNKKIDSFKQLFVMIYEHLALDKSSVDSYKVFFRELIELPNDGAVLWHCTQGKDRTGVAAYLLLTMLNVDEETIVKEYLLTNDVYKPQLEEKIKRDGEAKRKEYEEYMLVSQDNLRLYVKLMKEKYNSFNAFFMDALGLTKNEIAIIKNKFLE